MQNLVRSKTIGVTGNGGRGTAGAGPGRDPLCGGMTFFTEDHRDSLVEDHQDPFEDAQPEADPQAGAAPWTGRAWRRPSWRTPWGPR